MAAQRKRSADDPSNQTAKRSKATLEPTPPPAPKDWDRYVSASATRNILINDPILDYLAMYSHLLAAKKPAYAVKLVKAVSRRTDNFVEYIMSQGQEFETHVIKYLYEKLPSGVIVNIGGNGNARDEAKVKDTIAAMHKGVPIIYSGVLHDEVLETYGVPDLLVRSDWLAEISGVCPISVADAKISAPLLGNIRHPGKPVPYHYRVVDIKFTTLLLRADGIKILNSNSFPAYKGQLWIYTAALGRVQGYEPPQAYILGRRATYTTRGSTYKYQGCTDRFGTIDYADVDHPFIERTLKAIAWIRDLRAHGAEWDVFADKPKPELCPNMSNGHDHPWGEVKACIAEDTKEITSLWMCGVKNRELAHAQGIFKWTDPRCNCKVLGVNGPVTSKILSRILDVNRLGSTKKITPDVIEFDGDGWQSPQPLEFYVDFEFVNDVFTDFSSMPRSEGSAIIFMIGVGYFVPSDTSSEGTKETDPFTPPSKKWVYKSFTVDALTLTEERKVCANFSDYIRRESRYYKVKNPLMCHWSNAENWQWTHAYDRHDGFSRLWIPSKLDSDGNVDPRWFDLLEVFKKEPVVVKGALSFGLKEVAGAMHSHGMIKTTWDRSSGCTDGTSAMMVAFNSSKEAKRYGLPFSGMPQVKDVIRYNEVDCRVVGEIIEYLRGNHCA